MTLVPGSVACTASVCFRESVPRVYVRIVKTPSPQCACVASGYVGGGSARRTERLLAPVAKGRPSPGASRHDPAVVAPPSGQSALREDSGDSDSRLSAEKLKTENVQTFGCPHSEAR